MIESIIGIVVALLVFSIGTRKPVPVPVPSERFNNHWWEWEGN